MRIMLDVVYEGQVGKIKCEKCECWLGFEPADHMITAPCPTCANPLVVPPQALTFPDVKRASSISMKPKKRETAALPSFPDRNQLSKPEQEPVIRLVAEAPAHETSSGPFPDRAEVSIGQLSLPPTRASAGAVQDAQSIALSPRSVRSEAAPKGATTRAAMGFKPRLELMPNDGLNEGVAGDLKKGFVGNLQQMTVFLSVLAILMIVGVLTVVLFKKGESVSAKTIELNLPEKTTQSVEDQPTAGLVRTP